jgi:Protein of unknown function (DUF2794)
MLRWARKWEHWGNFVIFIADCYMHEKRDDGSPWRLAMRLASGDTFTAINPEARLSEQDPISFRPRLVPPGGAGIATNAPSAAGASAAGPASLTAAFSRHELNQILNLYGRKVASGEWRDYAIDFGREKAVFSVFRRTSECPLYTIEKSPKLARKQGAYSVVTATGLILKRGHELARVLEVLDKRVKLLQH